MTTAATRTLRHRAGSRRHGCNRSCHVDRARGLVQKTSFRIDYAAGLGEEVAAGAGVVLEAKTERTGVGGYADAGIAGKRAYVVSRDAEEDIVGEVVGTGQKDLAAVHSIDEVPAIGAVAQEALVVLQSDRLVGEDAAGVKETPYEDHGGGKSPDYGNPRISRAWND